MTIHVKAKVEPGGRVVVDHLPFEAGQQVELTIVTSPAPPSGKGKYPLQGSVYRYEDPFAPAIDPNDWEANR